jgi:hypothetical protein
VLLSGDGDGLLETAFRLGHTFVPLGRWHDEQLAQDAMQLGRGAILPGLLNEGQCLGDHGDSFFYPVSFGEGLRQETEEMGSPQFRPRRFICRQPALQSLYSLFDMSLFDRCPSAIHVAEGNPQLESIFFGEHDYRF